MSDTTTVNSVSLRHDGLLVVTGTSAGEGGALAFVRLVGPDEPDFDELAALLPST